ncbi:MAG: putative membrane protein [Enterobacterales bacterium]|jgi:putative membrane protein
MIEGHYFGMHLLWWGVWIILLIWIFAIPCSIPGSRSREKDAVEILKKRFARGEIEKDEYQEKLLMLKDE